MTRWRGHGHEVKGNGILAVCADKELWVACIDMKIRGSQEIQFRVIHPERDSGSVRRQYIVSGTEEDLVSDEDFDDEEENSDSESDLTE